MFREQGVSVQNNFASANEPAPQVQRTFAPIDQQRSAPRPEMRGPSLNPELENILSGLKKAPAAPSQPTTPRNETPIQMFTVEDVDDSMISISSLRDLQQNTNVPKGSSRRRKNGSEKNANTVRLDI